MFELPAPAHPKGVRGRPERYSPEVVNDILQQVATGRTLASVLREKNIDRSTMTHWRWRYPQIEKALAQAREYSEDTILDECLDIADNENEDPNSRKVRIWARLQVLEKRNPSKYGPKHQVHMNHDFTSILEGARARIVSDQ